jgi:FkbM family methyltransferase
MLLADTRLSPVSVHSTSSAASRDSGGQPRNAASIMPRLYRVLGALAASRPASHAGGLNDYRALYDTRWRVLRMAIGGEDGTAELHIMRHDQLNSLRAPSAAGISMIPDRGMTLKGVELVNLRRLDTVFDLCVDEIATPRVFLKVDVQGSDLDVFHGAGRCMRHVVALQPEISLKPIYEQAPSFDEAIHFLQSLGFNVTGLFPAGSLPNLAIIDLDCVMIRSTIGPPAPIATQLISESWKTG